MNFQAYTDNRSKSGPKTRYYSQCKDCKGHTEYGGLSHGFVPISRIRFVFVELTDALGPAETARRCDMTIQGLYYTMRKAKRVQKRTAISAINALREAREQKLREQAEVELQVEAQKQKRARDAARKRRDRQNPAKGDALRERNRKRQQAKRDAAKLAA